MKIAYEVQWSAGEKDHEKIFSNLILAKAFARATSIVYGIVEVLAVDTDVNRDDDTLPPSKVWQYDAGEFVDDWGFMP